MDDLEHIYGLDARNLENHLGVPSSVTSNLGIDVRFHFKFICVRNCAYLHAALWAIFS